MYGYNKANERFRNLAQKRHDLETNLVTYDPNTIYGNLNALRDALGYTFIDGATLEGSLPNWINHAGQTISIKNTYITADGTTKTSTTKHPLLRCIFYNMPEANYEYLVYGYSPVYTAIKGAPVDDPSITYYVKVGNVYKVANIANYQAKDRNGHDIDPEY
jgi:hypothetical protein